MHVAKWGNSLAIRISEDVVRALGLKEGDRVDLCALPDDQVAVITEQQQRAALIARLRALAVAFPPDYKFDREEANAR